MVEFWNVCEIVTYGHFIFRLFTVPYFFRKALAKWSQHAIATYRNIVGRNMLRAFGHHVATCWVLLPQV